MVLSNFKTSTELGKMVSVEKDSKFTRRQWTSCGAVHKVRHAIFGQF